MSATYTSRDLRRALDLYRRGLSTYDIACIMGIHHTTISKWVRRHGLARSRSEAALNRYRGAGSPEGRRRRHLARRAASLRLEGRSLRGIARDLGISFTTVKRLLDLPEARALLSGRPA